MKRLAAANVGLHLVGLVLGATVMRGGSIAEPLEARTSFLVAHALAWQLSWGVWMLAALAFAAFMASFARERPGARIALFVAILAATCDFFGDSMQIAVLPHFATEQASFLRFERLANFIGLVVANGLYSLAVLVASLHVEERAAKALGVATFLGGAMLAVAGFLDAPRLVVASAGPTILAYCAWVIAVARGRTPSGSRR